jgi:ParB/RepB/Spo0J family partition protein
MKTEEIKLSLLENSPDNVRRTMDKKALAELRASILSIGMVHNIVVVPHEKKYQVVAGARRLKVLQDLAEEGLINKNEAITCFVAESAQSVEISLAENIVREAMHPADEYEAYAALIAGGMTPEQVSLRFGCSVKHVNQRMRLGTVAPEIVKAFRAEKIDLDSLMAFASTPDQKKQLSVWKSLKEHERDNAWMIKNKLTEKMFKSDSPIAKFVGRADYEAAGGKFQGDLFSDRDTEYFVDGALLQKLADKKVNDRHAKFVAAGWGFVEIGTDDKEWSFCMDFETLPKEPKKEEKPKCGVYLFVNSKGELTARMLKKRGSSKGDKGKKETGGMSQALIDDLKAYRMEAFQAYVASNSHSAFTLLCFCAAMSVVGNNLSDYEDEEEEDYTSYFDGFSEIHFKPAQSSKVVVNEDTIGKQLLAKLKKNLDVSWNKGSKVQKFAAFVQLQKDAQQEFLSYAFALTLRGRMDEQFSAYTSAGLLAGVDVAKVWRPTYDNFFKRVDMATLDKIGKELFEKQWKSSKNKRKDAKFIAEAVSNPDKAANGDAELLKRLTRYLPSGMAFQAQDGGSNTKLKKSA